MSAGVIGHMQVFYKTKTNSNLSTTLVVHGQYLVGPRGEDGPGLWTGDKGRVGLTSVPSRSSMSGTTLRILSMPTPAAKMHLI